MDIVDAQVHLNRLGSDWQHIDPALIVDYAVVTMDALGLSGAAAAVAATPSAPQPKTWGVTVNQYGAWYFTDAWLDS